MRAPRSVPPPRRSRSAGAVLDRWSGSLADTAAAVLELVLPQTCAGCGEGGQAVCRVCRALVHRFTAVPFDAGPGAPQYPRQGLCLAAGVYRHELARLVLAYKNAGRTDAGPVLSRALARCLRAWSRTSLEQGAVLPGEEILLVPAPSSAASFRRRGFSPAEELARGALGWNRQDAVDWRLAPVLERRREGVLSDRRAGGQKGLGAGARSARVHGSMLLRSPPLLRALGAVPDVADRPCVLVDDVLTTGATLKEAHRVLEEAGARVLGSVVLAAVRAPDRPPLREELKSDTDHDIGFART